MKATFTLCMAALVGGIIGSIITAAATKVEAAGGTPKLEVRELVLVNENNRPAASLTSIGGRTVLTFFQPDG